MGFYEDLIKKTINRHNADLYDNLKLFIEHNTPT